MKSHILTTTVILGLIVLIGAFFRFYKINWDHSYHLHPDERAITLYTLPLSWPESIDEFLTTDSPLNPKFFAYGNFPLYLLKGAGYLAGKYDSAYSTYEKLPHVGRTLSALFDCLTIILIFFLFRKLANKLVGFLSSLFYALAVFPIQASHFYAVDILLTFFILLTLFCTIKLYEKTSFKNALLVGVVSGFALATKISALPIFLPISIVFIARFIHLYQHKDKKIVPKAAIMFLQITAVILATAALFIFLQPYVLIDQQEFIRQTIEQSRMTQDAYIFPYTLQYVGKVPYVYELKNIFFWGLGPLLSLFSFSGFFILIYSLYKKRLENTIPIIILLSFFLVYFFIVGRFAVGWMRYMLPLYPFLCFFAAFASIHSITKIQLIKSKFILNTLYVLLYTLLLLWPVSFLSIYTQDHSRVQASRWMLKNIPPGSTLAVEHWDDRLPLWGGEIYSFINLPLYNQPDDFLKWQTIDSLLEQSDYIVLASNRLYVPIQKLDDCNKYKTCFPLASKYYKELFSGQRGFVKVAEFSSYPTIPFLNIPVVDDTADESFTVYDHPKVIIFKKQ